MKETTKKRKKARFGIEAAYGRQWLDDQLYRILVTGKQGFDAMMKGMGRMMAEAIMYIEREEISGSDYQPLSPDIRKWASQPGSVYIGDQKIKAEHPRLRGPKSEIMLKSYQKLKGPEGFSEELLMKVMRGLSCQKYEDTVVEAATAFGVSPSSVSNHIIAATSR